MNILSTLNRTFTFFAINSKGQTCIEVFKNDYGNGDIEQVVAPFILKHAITAQKVYEIQIKRAFGLNFFASFIPFTDAFKARIAYLQTIENLYTYIDKKVIKTNSIEHFIHRLTTSPFYFLSDFFGHYLTISADFNSNPQIIKKRATNELLLELPFLHDFLSITKGNFSLNTQWMWNAFRTAMNPLRIVQDLLQFMYSGMDALAEVGLDKPSEATILSLIIKYTAKTIFLPLQLLVTSAVAVIDSLWTLLYHLTISPFVFLFESIRQAVEHFNQEFILADISSLQGAKVIRKIEKNRDLPSDRFMNISSRLSSVESQTNQYLVHSKEEVCTRTHHTHELTMIATSPKKAESIRSRIQFFDTFQQKHPQFLKTDCIDLLKEEILAI